jgi:TP901 family phage tail tape measure protein
MASPVVSVDVTGDTSKLESAIDSAVSGKKHKLSLGTSGFSAPLGKIKGELGEFDKSLAASNARVLAFGASAGAIYAIQKALSDTVQSTIQVEKSLAEVNVILGASEKKLASFGDKLFDIAKKTGSSFEDVALAGAELARQGLAMEATLKRTSDAMILARLSGLGVEASVNAITAALNGFRNAALTSTAVIDKIIAVDQAFAVSGADLAEALRRVGSTAEGAGVSLDQLMGIVTAAQQITARGGAVIGNSFKTIFTRIQRPRVIKELQNLGVATKDASGASLSAINVLKNLASTFDRLGEAQQAQIAELVGGVFQINVLKASLSDLSSQYSVYENATKTAAASSGEAALRNAQLNKTLSAGLNETLQNLTKLAAGVGKLTLEPAIRNVLGVVNAITEKVSLGDAEDKGAGIGKALLGGIGKFLSGPGLAIAAVALFQLFNNLRKFAVDAFTTFSGLNNSLKGQMQLQQGIVNILNQNPELLARIRNGEISIETAANEIVNSYKHLNSELVTANGLATALASTISSTSMVGTPTAGGPTSIVPKRKASGYVPNFNNAPEVAAMIQSGMYTKSQINNPRVRKGKVYDGQGGSFMASYNGHEKKRDVIGPNGRKGTIIENPLMQKMARGFIPNFAVRNLPELTVGEVVTSTRGPKGKMQYRAAAGALQKINSGKYRLDKLLSAAKIKQAGLLGAVTTAHKKQKGLGKGTPSINLKNKVGIITSRGNLSGGGISLATNQAETASFLGLPKDSSGASKPVTGLFVKRPQNLKGDGKIDEQISSSLTGPIAKAISSVGKQLFSPNERELPDVAKVRNYLKSPAGAEKLALTAGNIFEDAINAGIGLKDKSIGRRWDYTSGDFSRKGGMLGSLVGKNNISGFQKASVTDAKLSFPPSNIAEFRSKLFNTGDPTVKSAILKGFGLAAGGGYVPNFYKPLRDAVTRENKGGVAKSAIRVGSDRRLASGANPFGLAVTNTRDEPRGIKDVLARGHVPNFMIRPDFGSPMSGASAPAAPPATRPKPPARGTERERLLQRMQDKARFKEPKAPKAADTANKNLITATNANAKSMEKAMATQTKLMGAMMLANLATSTLAAATENASPTVKAISNAANSLTQGLSTAATIMMAFPGAWPMAAIAAIGVAALSFASSMDHASQMGMKYAEALSARSEELAEQQSAIQGAQQALAAYKTALDSGDAQAANDANKKVASALQALEPELRKQVMAAKDTEAAQRILAKQASEKGAEKTQVEKSKAIREQKNKEDEKAAKEQTQKTVLKSLIGIAAIVGAWFAWDKGSKLVGSFKQGASGASGVGAFGRGGPQGAKGGFAALTKGGSRFGQIIGKIGTKIMAFGGSISGLWASVSAAFGSAGIAGAAGALKTALVGALGGLGSFLQTFLLIPVGIMQGVSWLSTALSKGFKAMGLDWIGKKFEWLGDKMDLFGGIMDYVNSREGLEEAEKNLSNERYNKSFDPAAGIWDNLKIPFIKGVKEGNVQSRDEEGTKQMASDAKSLLALLDSKDMATGDNIQKLMLAARNGEDALRDAFVELGFGAEVVASHLEGAGDQSRNLVQQIQILDNTRDAEIATIKRQQKVMNAHKAAAAAAAEALRNANIRSMEFVEGIQAFGIGLAKFRAKAVDNTRAMLNEIAQGGRKLAKQFMTAEQGNLLERGGKSQAINETARLASNKARDKGMNAMVDAVQNFGPIADLMKKAKEDPGGMSASQRRLVGMMGNLRKRGALGGAGAGEIGPALQTLLQSNLAQQALGGKQDIRNIPGLQKVLLQQVAEMREAEQTRQQQLRLANLQFTLQRMQDKINREKGMGGGIKTFLDPKQMDDMEDGFNQAVDDFRKASNRGDTVKTGQAAGNLLGNLKDFMGGAAVGPGFEGLKDLTQKGLEQSLRGRAMARADVMEQAGKDTGNQDLIQAAQALRNMDFASAAATQTALEFKRQRMPANIEGMLGVQRSIQQLQQSDVVANQSTARATQGTLNFLTGGGMQAAMQGIVAAINADPNAAGAPGAVPGLSFNPNAPDAAAMNAGNATEDRLNIIKASQEANEKLGPRLEAYVEKAQADGLDTGEITKIRAMVLEIKKNDKAALDAFAGLSAKDKAVFSPTDQANIRARGGQAFMNTGATSYTDRDRAAAPLLHTGIKALQAAGQQYRSPSAQSDENRLRDRDRTHASNRILGILDEVENKQVTGKSASVIRADLEERLLHAQNTFNIQKQKGGMAAQEANQMIPVMKALEKMIEMTRQADARGDNKVLHAGFMGTRSGFDRGWTQDLMDKFTVNNVINVTIPANLSGTGRDEVYRINNRVNNIANNSPASVTGPGNPMPPSSP